VKAPTVWLVHLINDYSSDIVYVFDSREKAEAWFAANENRYPEAPYEAVVE